MLRIWGIVLLFSLTGCLTPTQREVEEAKDRVKLLELESNIQRLETEMCQSRNRHAMSCRGKCTISREVAKSATTVATSNKKGSGVKKAPLSIYSPR